MITITALFTINVPARDVTSLDHLLATLLTYNIQFELIANHYNIIILIVRLLALVANLSLTDLWCVCIIKLIITITITIYKPPVRDWKTGGAPLRHC